jgi:hypothetical protein
LRSLAAPDPPRDVLAAPEGVALVGPDRVTSLAAVDVVAPAVTHVERVVPGAAAYPVAACSAV